jgi:hypothetical protein
MTYESQADRFARLNGYLNSVHQRPLGVHRDTKRESEYPFFVLWADGADSFDTKREAARAFKEYKSYAEYRKDEYC